MGWKGLQSRSLLGEGYAMLSSLCPSFFVFLISCTGTSCHRRVSGVNECQEIVTLFNVVWSDALALNRRPCIGPSEDRAAHAIVQVEDMQALKDKYSSELVVMMRVYFEKPHTTVGWRGLINDPDLNSTFNVNTGLRTARKVLLDINVARLTQLEARSECKERSFTQNMQR